MDQLSAQDAQFLYMEDADVVASITAVQICDQSTAPGGTVRFKDIIAKLESRLSHSPIYNRHLMRVPMELDFPYWVEDPHFDIENHVRHARLPEPADWRQFCIHVARYHSRPLDMGRPLWEAYIVEGLDNLEGVPKGSFALIFKLHHAAVDGASAAQFLGTLWDVTPDGIPGLPVEPVMGGHGTHAPTLPGTLMRAAVNNARSPVRMTQAVMRSSPQISRALINAGRARIRKTGGVPKTVFNGKVGQQKVFDATRFKLSDVKIIRTAYPEAKVNDVVLAVCSGGVRRYLKSKDALPSESLVTTAPINTRGNDGADGVAGGGNNISAMTVPLHTNIAHPVERLKAIVLSTRKTKAAKEGLAARLMTDLTQHVPAATMALASRLVIQNSNAAQNISNLTISNVPGPQLPLYFCGAKLVTGYGLAPLANGMGLFISTPSYNGEITFGVTSSREIMPDVAFFIECLEKSFQELLAAATRRLEVNTAAEDEQASAQKPKRRRTRITRVSEAGSKAKARATRRSKANGSTRPST
ncbi:wax ester/triacylglycerol synthase family O-acyltransferase [Parvularcula sp. IMCC14364]|uniref:WS/DGAT/MGAT family O-acyltransferase n=1 Tax=Parvularcula sp. IMCC14364 TaxID=3067902 RepID=UPI0027411A14|nr:wax ester/triacylglycerol synthase family O-acyltransferase [Parvularcula sp. IMCC14364]